MNSSTGWCSLISSIVVVLVVIVESLVQPRENIPKVTKTSTFLASGLLPLFLLSSSSILARGPRLLALVTLWGSFSDGDHVRNYSGQLIKVGRVSSYGSRIPDFAADLPTILLCQQLFEILP
ncbi:hypothetical protein Tco_0869449 [Tanacetum coccineum]